MKSRFVLDVNIWVSAIITGKLYKLSKHLLEYDLTVYTCDELLEELTDVLNRGKIKKYLTKSVSAYVYEIKRNSTRIEIIRKYHKAPDPDDNYLYDLCLGTKSTLVTGDKALLAHTSNPPVPTISMKAFFDKD